MMLQLLHRLFPTLTASTMSDLSGLGPSPGPIRLYGNNKDQTVALFQQVQDHMLFNPDYTPEAEEFIRVALAEARQGRLSRENRKRLAAMVRRFQREVGVKPSAARPASDPSR